LFNIRDIAKADNVHERKICFEVLWRARSAWATGPRSEGRGNKNQVPKEDIKWKHPAEMIICLDINIDNLETYRGEKAIGSW